MFWLAGCAHSSAAAGESRTWLIWVYFLSNRKYAISVGVFYIFCLYACVYVLFSMDSMLLCASSFHCLYLSKKMYVSCESMCVFRMEQIRSSSHRCLCPIGVIGRQVCRYQSEVLLWLGYRDILRLEKLNRLTRELARSDEVWPFLCVRVFLFSRPHLPPHPTTPIKRN